MFSYDQLFQVYQKDIFVLVSPQLHTDVMLKKKKVKSGNKTVARNGFYWSL